MKNGCPECKKLDDDKMCSICELGMFEYGLTSGLSQYAERVDKALGVRNWCELDLLLQTAEAAVQDYVNKVNEILAKINERNEQ